MGALLTLEAVYPDPPTPGDRPAVEGLRGGAAILMVGAFENYLREAFAAALDDINLARPDCHFDRLPVELQTASVYSGLELAMKGAHNTAGLKRSQRLPDIFMAVRRIDSRRVDGAAVARTGGNPNSALVKGLFKTIGVSNVFANTKRAFETQWGSPIAQTFINDTLDIVVKRRHAVAHTASALAVSRPDLADARRFLSVLCIVLDAALDRQVSRIIAAAQ